MRSAKLALGFTGPQRDYDRLVAVDVGEHFDFRVHGEYKIRLPMLVPENASNAVPPDAFSKEFDR